MNKVIELATASHRQIRTLYRMAIDASMGGKQDNDLKHERYYVLHQLALHSILRRPDLSIVECGVWKGHSTYMLDRVRKIAKHQATFFAFDSFDGESKQSKEDGAEKIKRHQPASIFDLAKLLPDVAFVEGWIPEVLMLWNERIGERIAFANIDVNLFEPTLHSLEYLYRKLAPGGAIFLDDYGYPQLPGATKAVDLAVSRMSPPPSTFVALPFGSAFLIK